MKKIVELKNITKSFDAEPVLKGIDLDALTLEAIIKQALKKMVK